MTDTLQKNEKERPVAVVGGLVERRTVKMVSEELARLGTGLSVEPGECATQRGFAGDAVAMTALLVAALNALVNIVNFFDRKKAGRTVEYATVIREITREMAMRNVLDWTVVEVHDFEHIVGRTGGACTVLIARPSGESYTLVVSLWGTKWTVEVS